VGWRCLNGSSVLSLPTVDARTDEAPLPERPPRTVKRIAKLIEAGFPADDLDTISYKKLGDETLRAMLMRHRELKGDGEREGLNCTQILRIGIRLGGSPHSGRDASPLPSSHAFRVQS
jgi:hypothetical protein